MNRVETLQPNAPAAVSRRAAQGQVRWGPTLLALVSRGVLFAVWQAVIALALAAGGAAQPWEASIAWWPLSATLTSLTSLALLTALLRREGLGYRDLLAFERGSVGRDALMTLGVTLLALPVSYLPNIALGGLLFGDPAVTLELMFRPLPAWGLAVALALFPLTVALSELPTYFGYVRPRLAALTGQGGLSLVIAALALAFQHVALPLIFDVRFFAWRAGMFIPFALLAGFTLYKRPRLLPYLLVVHWLMDMFAALTLLAV